MHRSRGSRPRRHRRRPPGPTLPLRPEGYLTYGLGIQTAANSDQVLRIRAGELKKPDGSGGFFYVVHVDVEAG